MAWIFWIYLVNTILMLIVAVRETRRPAVALNCLVIGLVLPILGFIFYLLTFKPARMKRERLTSMDNPSDKLPDSFGRSAQVIAHSLRQFTVHGMRRGRIQTLNNGIPTYEQLVASIQNAKRTIDMEYYIYRNDKIGRRITDLLMERAAAGVTIRFLRDGFGSHELPRKQITQMMEAGIDCRTFYPLRFPWLFSTLNYRDHCKIVVVDGQEAFTGGINVGDEYTGLKPEIGFWRDTHLRMTGEAVKDLETVFDVHWEMATQERKRARRERDPVSNPTAQTTFTPAGLAAEMGAELGTVDAVEEGIEQNDLIDAYVQTLEGNPGLSTQTIREAFFICITQAERTIDITTPYFIPNGDLITAIKTAVLRGVRVRLLVPERVDHRIVGQACLSYLGELIEAGVEVYLYRKGIMHAKVMVIDGEVVEVGAANYDIRSFRLDYEVCEMMYSKELARELTEQFERDLKECGELTVKELEARSAMQRIVEQGARLLTPLL